MRTASTRGTHHPALSDRKQVGIPRGVLPPTAAPGPAGPPPSPTRHARTVTSSTARRVPWPADQQRSGRRSSSLSCPTRSLRGERPSPRPGNPNEMQRTVARHVRQRGWRPVWLLALNHEMTAAAKRDNATSRCFCAFGPPAGHAFFGRSGDGGISPWPTRVNRCTAIPERSVWLTIIRRPPDRSGCAIHGHPRTLPDPHPDGGNGKSNMCRHQPTSDHRLNGASAPWRRSVAPHQTGATQCPHPRRRGAGLNRRPLLHRGHPGHRWLRRRACRRATSPSDQPEPGRIRRLSPSVRSSLSPPPVSRSSPTPPPVRESKQSSNELEMRDPADYAFAMYNAHPLLRARARYVAPPNTDNGVVRTHRLDPRHSSRPKRTGPWCGTVIRSRGGATSACTAEADPRRIGGQRPRSSPARNGGGVMVSAESVAVMAGTRRVAW